MEQKKTVFICKPGCDLMAKEGKTNLQLRELQAFKTACFYAGVETRLITIPELLDMALDLQGASIVCFNSAACFQDEFGKLISMISVIENIDLTLISNDCRLNFNLDTKYDKVIARLLSHTQTGESSLRILTNATKDLESYRSIVMNWTNAELVPIYSAQLYTLPTFMEFNGKHVDKTTNAVFTCMHFKDYSEQRQKQLIQLKEYFGENLVLSGDLSGMTIYAGETVKSVVTDTATVWQWYKPTKVTPVLLEPRYDKYGVIPNRVAEAVMCRCVPITYTERTDNYTIVEGITTPIVSGDITELIEVMERYMTQYDTEAVQKEIDRLQIQLGADKTSFTTVLRNLYL